MPIETRPFQGTVYLCGDSSASRDALLQPAGTLPTHVQEVVREREKARGLRYIAGAAAALVVGAGIGFFLPRVFVLVAVIAGSVLAFGVRRYLHPPIPAPDERVQWTATSFLAALSGHYEFLQSKACHRAYALLHPRVMDDITLDAFESAWAAHASANRAAASKGAMTSNVTFQVSIGHLGERVEIDPFEPRLASVECAYKLQGSQAAGSGTLYCVPLIIAYRLALVEHGGRWYVASPLPSTAAQRAFEVPSSWLA